MILTISKNVGGVDFGVAGKKTINLDLRLEKKKDSWSFFCYYAYIVNNDGTKVPVGQSMLDHKFLKDHIDKALEEIKVITDYKLDVNVK